VLFYQYFQKRKGEKKKVGEILHKKIKLGEYCIKKKKSLGEYQNES